jgi:hypothetical protein
LNGIIDMAAGQINSKNMITLVGIAILVGTEVFAVALAAGWAIAGLFQLGVMVGYALMTIFSVMAAYGLWAFMKKAIAVERSRS